MYTFVDLGTLFRSCWFLYDFLLLLSNIKGFLATLVALHFTPVSK